MKLLPLLLALCAASAALPAAAQTEVRRAQVYRCGPDGRDLRDSPCPGAAARGSSEVMFDQPSAADTRAARERHRTEAREAEALARSRRASEAEARRQRGGAVLLQTLPPPVPAASAAPPMQLKSPKLKRPRKRAATASSGAGR